MYELRTTLNQINSKCMICPALKPFLQTSADVPGGVKASWQHCLEEDSLTSAKVWRFWETGQLGCGSKPMVPFLGRCTTHFRIYFSGDWDVHGGYGILTHDHLIGITFTLRSSAVLQQ